MINFIYMLVIILILYIYITNFESFIEEINYKEKHRPLYYKDKELNSFESIEYLRALYDSAKIQALQDKHIYNLDQQFKL